MPHSQALQEWELERADGRARNSCGTPLAICRRASALHRSAAAVASESALPYRWMRLSCLRQVTIEASDDFLVLATDGVWGEPWLGFRAFIVGGGRRPLPRVECIRASARHPFDHSAACERRRCALE